MRRSTLTVGGRDFVLAEGQDVDQLKATAVDALKAGGGTLDFISASTQTLGIVLSPGVPVIFKTVTIDDDEEAEVDVTAHAFEIDSFDYET